MKMKTKTRNHGWYLLWGVLALVSFCFLSCKDDDKSEEQQPFDPTKPVLFPILLPKRVVWGHGSWSMETISGTMCLE